MTTGAGSPFGVWTGASPFTLGETSAPTPLSTLDSGSSYAAVWEFHPDGPHSVAFSAAGSDADSPTAITLQLMAGGFDYGSASYVPGAEGSLGAVGPVTVDASAVYHLVVYLSSGTIAETRNYVISSTIDGSGDGGGDDGGGGEDPPPDDPSQVHGTNNPTIEPADENLNITPDFQLTVMDKVIRRAPSAITISVAGGLPQTDITFLMDSGGSLLDPTITQEEMYTTELDSDGALGPTSLTVLEFLGGQQGDRTITAVQHMPDGTAVSAFDTYTMRLPPIQWPGVQGPDLDPVDVPEAVVDGVRRWVFQDLMGVEDGGIGSYVLDHNPREMSSPHLEQALTSRHTTAHSGRFHIWQAGQMPKEWTFSGQTWSQEMLDMLAAYRALNRRFWVIDHRNRAWKVVFTNLEIVPHLRQTYNGEVTDLGTDWTVTATILDQNFRTPV